MRENYIPGLEPAGQSYETARLIIGLVVLVLGLVGTVVYLRWKLTKEVQPLGEQENQEPEGPPG